MKLFKATVAAIGISLCITGCNKANTENAAANADMNAATSPAADTNVTTTDMNGANTDMNATVANDLDTVRHCRITGNPGPRPSC